MRIQLFGAEERDFEAERLDGLRAAREIGDDAEAHEHVSQTALPHERDVLADGKSACEGKLKTTRVPTLFVDARALTTPLTSGSSAGVGGGWSAASSDEVDVSGTSVEEGGRRNHHSTPIAHSLSKLYTLKSKRELRARSGETRAVYALEICPSIGLKSAVIVVGG